MISFDKPGSTSFIIFSFVIGFLSFPFAEMIYRNIINRRYIFLLIRESRRQHRINLSICCRFDLLINHYLSLTINEVTSIKDHYVFVFDNH